MFIQTEELLVAEHTILEGCAGNLYCQVNMPVVRGGYGGDGAASAEPVAQGHRVGCINQCGHISSIVT